MRMCYIEAEVDRHVFALFHIINRLFSRFIREDMTTLNMHDACSFLIPWN